MKVIISNVAQCLKTLVCSVLRLTQTDSNFCLLSRHSSCFMGTCCFICSSLSVVLGEKHCRPTVSPLKRKLGGKKDCWTAQLSLLIWKLQENICELSTSPTTECGALSAEPPFGPSLLHAFILLVNSEISQTRANKYNSHNSHLPPVISLPHHLLLFMYLIALEYSAVSQIVLNSAAHS